MKKKNILIVLLITISLSIVIYLAVKIYNANLLNEKGIAQTLPSIYELTSEDSSLISESLIGDMEVKEVFRNKMRNSVSLIYLKDRYQLLMYKMDFQTNIPLSGIIETKIKSVKQSIGYAYRIINANTFYFRYRAGDLEPLSNLFLTISGDSVQTVQKTDSSLMYYFHCDNMSIRYSYNDPIDIIVEKKGNNNFPMNLMFVKKNTSLYLLIMTAKDRKVIIDPKSILEVINL